MPLWFTVWRGWVGFGTGTGQKQSFFLMQSLRLWTLRPPALCPAAQSGAVAPLSGPQLNSPIEKRESVYWVRKGSGNEEAVKLLRQLLTIPAGEFVSVTRLKIDAVRDPIRNDPGFQKLLSEPEPETIYK